MGDFKVGDKVRVLQDDAELAAVEAGQVLTVTKADAANVVARDANGDEWWFSPKSGVSIELELDIKDGDRFRYTVEGTYRATDFPGLNVGTFGDERDFEMETGDGDVITIEKVEPPVVTFKPGDFVRRKSDGDVLYLAKNGWLNMTSKRFYQSEMIERGEFRSDGGFEKVEYAEVPF